MRTDTANEALERNFGMVHSILSAHAALNYYSISGLE